MRITGNGTGGFGGGSGKGQDRGMAFRRRHRPGERLTGRVMRREAPGLAWVDFQGLELLASIQSSPEPGTLLLFEVIRTDPDILLRELHTASAHGDPLGTAVEAFRRARAQFEIHSEAMRAALPCPGTSPADRQAAFTTAMEADADLAAAYQAVELALQQVSALTLALGAGRVEYRPWLLPPALSGEMLIREKPCADGDGPPLIETVFAFTLPDAGHCELRLLESPPRASARLLAEHPAHAEAVMRLFAEAGYPGPEVRFFDPAPLPAVARAGALASLLAPDPRARPRLSRRV